MTSTTPTIAWTKLLGGSQDTLSNLSISTDGSIYVAGNYWFENEAFLTRYNPDGTDGGTRLLDLGGLAKIESLTTGTDGAIYVAGFTESSFDGQTNSGNSDAFITRFNPDGSKAWTKLLGGANRDQASSLTTGTDGAIYVAGYTSSHIFDGQTTNGSEDAFITRYNPDGTKAWTKLLGGSYTDWASSLTTGTDGAIYVAGYTLSPSFDGQANNGNDDSRITRYNPDGSKAWTSYDAFITRYNPDGSKAWTKLLGGGSEDFATSLTTGIDGAIYMAGVTNSPSFDGQTTNRGASDAFITRYNLDGTKAWTKLLGGIGWDYASGITTGIDSAVYMTGFTDSPSFDGQTNDVLIPAFITRYDSDGSKAWTKLLGAANRDQASSLAIGVDGAIYYAGRTQTLKLSEPSYIFIPSITKLNESNLTGSVTINGTAKLGLTLTTTHSLADADGMGPISYQWQADGARINGAINPTLTLTEAHKGKMLRVIASYTDGAGTLEQVTSNSVQVANFNTSTAENSTLIKTISPSDTALGKAPKFALDGTDANLFKISTKGVLTFATAKDYEQPVDSNKDGIYEVSVVMSNAKTGYKITQDLTVGVEFAAIQGTAAADTLKGTKGWDTVNGLAGNDKLTGDLGLDTFIISSGSDSITDFNNLGTAVGQEILQVSSNASVSATLKTAWTATSASFNNGTATLLSAGSGVDLSAIDQGQGWNLTNTGKSTTFKGSLFDDVLTGGAATDNLIGGAGNDVLNGGKGIDYLTGGTGADTFRLTGGTGIFNADFTTDFVSGVDKIQIDATLLKNETKGQLSAAAFTVGKTATNTTQHFVYDNTNGNLWFDADGSGTKVKAVLLGTLDSNAVLTANDVWIV